MLPVHIKQYFYTNREQILEYGNVSHVFWILRLLLHVIITPVLARCGTVASMSASVLRVESYFERKSCSRSSFAFPTTM